jgi:hypothetical protein
MAIFAKLLLDKVVQVDDATRLDATRTFVSKDEAAITLVEVEPEAGNGFVDVTGTKNKDWFLDWQYAGASRTVLVSVRVTTDGAPVTSSFNMGVLTELDDYLFSDDQDLLSKEEDILKWLPAGRTSFKYKHRQAQTMIIEDFNERGIEGTDRNKLTKAAVVDIDEVRQWALSMTLALIFRDNSNVVGDLYSLKADLYNSEGLTHKHRAFFRLDLNGDGSIESGEKSPVRTIDMVRS